MKSIILDFLKDHKNKTVSLIEIEKILPGNIEYINFANTINDLVV